ncbi:MAG: hypothetical protein M1504_00570 [Candidatus Marsarchaeota archaeon]|nr:hypothetical protein [Candidatus Marsarchaeota archaeon]
MARKRATTSNYTFVVSMLIIAILLLAIVLISIPMVENSGNNFNGCAISIPNRSMSFGVLNPMETTPTNVSVVDSNPGTDPATIMMAGSNWTDTDNDSFYVTNTEWSASPMRTYGGNALQPYSSGLQNTSVNIGNDASKTLYFGLNIPPAQPSGAYSQTILIINSC